MLKKVLPIFALLLGLAGGGTAAIVLAPPPDETSAPDDQGDALDSPSETSDESNEDGVPGDLEIVKLPNQFVVPVLFDNRVRAMVILTVALEVELGQGDRVRTLEPKLRDEFLAELFNLAALDGFKDDLITRETLELVKRALSARANAILGTKDVTVLLTDMTRQDTF